METVLEEWEEVSMPVILVEEEIASSVQQQTQGADDKGVGFAPVANPKKDEKKRDRVEEVKEVLPLWEEIPFPPDQALWVPENERLHRKENKHRHVWQHSTDEGVAVETWYCFPTQERDVNDGVGLGIHRFTHSLMGNASPKSR